MHAHSTINVSILALEYMNLKELDKPTNMQMYTTHIPVLVKTIQRLPASGLPTTMYSCTAKSPVLPKLLTILYVFRKDQLCFNVALGL